MNTHNICSRGEIRKILCGYPLLAVAMLKMYCVFLVAASRNTVDAKRRRTRGKTEASGDDHDLSDGVEWYEEDTCDAADCKRPKKKRTPWVSSVSVRCQSLGVSVLFFFILFFFCEHLR